jgi:hypothetical protein
MLFVLCVCFCFLFLPFLFVLCSDEKYQTFLRRVQNENMGEYPDIQFILTRYHCLVDAHNDLTKRQKEVIENLESWQQKFVQYTKDQQNATLAFNNDIARLSKELELTQKHASSVEEQVDSTANANCAMALKLGQIIMAIENVYTRCKMSSRILNHTKTVEDIQNSASNTHSTTKRGLKADSKNSNSENNSSSDAAADSAAAAGQQLRATTLKQTIARLDVIVHYLNDYSWVVKQYGGNTTS